MTYPGWVSNYYQTIVTASQTYNVPTNDIIAIIQQESGGNPNALSPAGAVGLMQVVGGPTDPVANINAGTSFFSQMLARYSGDVTKALAAYNTGPGNLDRYGLAAVLSPDWAGGETMRYVAIVEKLILDYGGSIPPGSSNPNPASYTPMPVPAGSGIPTPFGTISVPTISIPSVPDVPGAISGAGRGVVSAIQQAIDPLTSGIANVNQFLQFFANPKAIEAALMISTGVVVSVLGIILFALSLIPNKGGRLALPIAV